MKGDMKARPGQAVLVLVTSGQIPLPSGIIMPFVFMAQRYAPVYGLIISSGIEGIPDPKQDENGNLDTTAVVLPQNWQTKAGSYYMQLGGGEGFHSGDIAVVESGSVLMVLRPDGWEPWGDGKNALVERIHDEETEFGSFVKPDFHDSDNQEKGRVVRIGRNCREVKPGDVVIYNPFACARLTLNDNRFWALVPESEIFCTLSGENP